VYICINQIKWRYISYFSDKIKIFHQSKNDIPFDSLSILVNFVLLTKDVSIELF
jgi:hypothetical protein